MQKLTNKIATTLTFTLFSLAAAGTKANAQSLPICPPTGTVADLSSTAGPCRGTPDRYVVSIYEMGLCTTNPLSTGSFDPTSCHATFTSSGTSVNLAGGATISLGGSGGSGGTRPPDGKYPSAYIIIGNTFGLRGGYKLVGGGGGTVVYGSDSSGNAVAGGAATNFTETLTNFNPGGGCTPTAFENVGTGRLEALITDASLGAATSCSGVARIIGAFSPTTPIMIDPATTGLEVTFSVTNNGMTLVDGGAPGFNLVEYQSGPFSPSFKILK